MSVALLVGGGLGRRCPARRWASETGGVGGRRRVVNAAVCRSVIVTRQCRGRGRWMARTTAGRDQAVDRARRAARRARRSVDEMSRRGMAHPLDPPAGAGRLGVRRRPARRRRPWRGRGSRRAAARCPCWRPRRRRARGTARGRAPSSASRVSAVTDAPVALDLDRRRLDAVDPGDRGLDQRQPIARPTPRPDRASATGRRRPRAAPGRGRAGCAPPPRRRRGPTCTGSKVPPNTPTAARSPDTGRSLRGASVSFTRHSAKHSASSSPVPSLMSDAPSRHHVLVRVWLPDRPGALGLVASRIGAVDGDIVGIDVLERGDSVAVDEFAVLLRNASRSTSSCARSKRSTARASKRCAPSTASPTRASTRSSRRRRLCAARVVDALHQTLVGQIRGEFLGRLERARCSTPRCSRRPATPTPDASGARGAGHRHRGVAAGRRRHHRPRRPRGRVAARRTEPRLLVGRDGPRRSGAASGAQLLALAGIADRTWALLACNVLGNVPTMASVAVVVFTRDLRVDDHPALARAVRRGGAGGAAVRVRRRDPRQLATTGPTAPGSSLESLARPRRRAAGARRRAGGAARRLGRRGRRRRRRGRRGLGARERRRERVRPRRARRASPTRCPSRSSARRGSRWSHRARSRRAPAVSPGATTTRCSRRTSGAGPRCAVATWSTRRTTSRCPTASTRAPAAARRAGRRRPLPGRRAGGRQRRARPARGVDRVGAARLRRPPRRPARRCHVAPLAVPPLRVPLTTGGAARRRAPSGRGSRCVRAAAVLARLLRAGPRRPARRRVVRLRRPRRPLA